MMFGPAAPWLTLGLLCLLCPGRAQEQGHELLGPGDCRGDGWAEGVWPLGAGKHSLKSCSKLCQSKQDCTGFSFSQAGDCVMFGHSDLVPAETKGGQCFRVKKEEETKKVKEEKVTKTSPTPQPSKKEPVSKPVAKKEEKVEPTPIKKSPVEEKKPVKKETKAVDEEETVNGKFIVKIGEGGCRGQGWNSAPWPIDQGRLTKVECAKTCIQHDCSAFHMLHFDEDGSGDCLIFNHKTVLAVSRLGGECLTLSDTPAAKDSGTKVDEADEDEEENEVNGPVFMALLGKGRCRGPGWTFKKWPTLKGVTSAQKCAEACAKKKGCTAFDLSDQQDGKNFECVLYGHKKVQPASSVPGNCYILSDKEGVVPESLGETAIEEEIEEEEEEVEVKGPVYMALLGAGRCRGPEWTTKKWPALRGFLNPRQCAEACAKKKGCTAFDLSDLQDDNTFDCVLYGHKKISPASSVPGNCYVLSETDGIIPGEVKEEEEVEEDMPIDQPVHMALLGQGRCRGSGWTFRKWPKSQGFLSPTLCAEACAKKKGCTAFDLSDGQDDDTFDCMLYGHKPIQPASSVSGKCFVLSETEGVLPGETVDEEQEEEEEEEVMDGTNHEYDYLGYGMCRGANWQSKRWPKLRGLKSLQECADSCGRKRGCTSFDISKPEGSEFECILYGHKKAVPAPGVPGECYALSGANYFEESIEVEVGVKEEEYEEMTDIKDVQLLGRGACRGQGWQDGQWPIVEGRKTIEDCAVSCKETKGCVAFDLSNKDQELYDCLLLGHPKVLPATGLRAKCFTIKGAKPDLASLKLEKASKPQVKADDDYPLEAGDFFILGSGRCRGTGWGSKSWPKNLGQVKAEDCAEECDSQKGCTGFDLSEPTEEGLFSCLLYGHTAMTPASSSSMTGACYTRDKVERKSAEEEEKEDEEIEDEEESVIDLEGEVDVALLGKGGCRGAGWQDKSWPKVKGFMSIDDCGRTCVATRGCTSFHAANQQEDSPEDFECFLFGHKSVIPAAGLPGDCYTVTKGSQAKSVEKAKKVEKVEKPKKKKVYKVPEFEEPTVIEDEFDEEDEWLFEPPPREVRSREHLNSILGLEETTSDEVLKITETTLKELKKVYESSIKDLEKTYKYKELSNRHFGDPEMFNKPLVVLMGPWSGGKSTMINYLLGTEYNKDAFRTTAEPSPGFNFNLAMYGETAEEVDGTQLAAEWAFSSLQKFGEEFLKKLRGKKMPNKLLEKATFAEIPGVLETGTIRKIDRRYPFNDACQWFIDHADLIILVYDYAKLDIGPETEALLDQLKGRESQVRIILNKADEITAEELLKIQGNLVWNVSPLMASVEPPTLYAGSFWSRPYKAGAPKRLLKSQEESLLKDIREAIDKRVENRISTARRFAVRVRNHAKMVDCYLTTYKNNKGYFGDKKRVAQDIIDNPSKYHIYEGISQLTNISRYDLPDPDTYRDFFNVHPLYDFPSLQSTCTFFKGCPLNKLDIAIAYELPEILTGFKRKVAEALNPKPKVVAKEPNKSQEKVLEENSEIVIPVLAETLSHVSHENK